MRLITQDLAQLHPRATREELGESYQPSLLADPSAQFALEFSRGGWANPAGFARGTVLRVAYNWEDDKLVRWHWAGHGSHVVDAARAHGAPRRRHNVEVRFLDTAGEWHLEWPPLNQRGPQSLISRPRAVEFALELEDFGRVYRLVETSG